MRRPLPGRLAWWAIAIMIDIPSETIPEDETFKIQPLAEYEFLTELSEEQRLKLELIEGIRHASDRKAKTKLIEEAANHKPVTRSHPEDEKDHQRLP